MTELFRCRVDKDLLEAAKRVADDVGISPQALVNAMFQQLVKRRTVPFPLSADAAEDEVMGSPKRRSELWDEMYEGNPKAR